MDLRNRSTACLSFLRYAPEQSALSVRGRCATALFSERSTPKKSIPQSNDTAHDSHTVPTMINGMLNANTGAVSQACASATRGEASRGAREMEEDLWN